MVRTDGGGVKWYFAEEQDGNGKVRIYTKKGPLKHKEEEYGEVVNITTSKSDAMDEKLKVMFLLLSLTIYTITGILTAQPGAFDCRGKRETNSKLLAF